MSSTATVNSIPQKYLLGNWENTNADVFVALNIIISRPLLLRTVISCGRHAGIQASILTIPSFYFRQTQSEFWVGKGERVGVTVSAKHNNTRSLIIRTRLDPKSKQNHSVIHCNTASLVLPIRKINFCFRALPIRLASESPLQQQFSEIS